MLERLLRGSVREPGLRPSIDRHLTRIGIRLQRTDGSRPLCRRPCAAVCLAVGIGVRKEDENLIGRRDPGIVDLWTLPVDVPAGLSEGWHDHLNASDWVRVRRAVGPDKRRERLASFAWRTIVQDRYQGTEQEIGLPSPCLSISHSSSWILIAACWGARIGVDIERQRPTRGPEALARRFFSPQEAEGLLAVGDVDREEAFFRTWVRKEAYLKAVGGGVPAGLRRLTVSVGSGEATVLETEFEPGGRSAFALYDLDVPDGYAGALAVEGAGHRIRYLDRSCAADGIARRDEAVTSKQ